MRVVGDAVADQIVQHTPQQSIVPQKVDRASWLHLGKYDFISTVQTAIQHFTDSLAAGLYPINIFEVNGLERIFQLGSQVQIIDQPFHLFAFPANNSCLLSCVRWKVAVIFQLAGIPKHHRKRCADVVRYAANPLRSSTVLRILEDERYIGSYVIGRRAVIEVGGTRSRMKDRDKWFIIPDHHPAIIEKELFEKVQAVQRRFSLPTRKIREYPLKGKVYCGCCDHALSRIAQKKPFYMCRHSTANVNSRCHTIRADAAGLEEAVLITLKKQLEILLPAHEDGTLHLDATAAKCSEYEKQLEDLRDQKQALFERYLLGQIELDAYKSEKAVYDAEIRKVKNAYAAVTAQAKLKQEEQARQSNRQEIVHSIAEADALTSELTDLLIEKVYVFPNNCIEIVYRVHDLFE